MNVAATKIEDKMNVSNINFMFVFNFFTPFETVELLGISRLLATYLNRLIALIINSLTFRTRFRPRLICTWTNVRNDNSLIMISLTFLYGRISSKQSFKMNWFLYELHFAHLFPINKINVWPYSLITLLTNKQTERNFFFNFAFFAACYTDH